MIPKIILALLMGAAGYFTWRQASGWKGSGTIPSNWNDGFGDVKRREGRDRNFGAVIFFQKGIAAMAWLFCMMCIASLIFGWGEE